MTSAAPERGDNNLVDREEPYYTNDDVAILHDIVTHAQELLPTLPERERVSTNALFNAYYAILPTVGIDADHDSRYARILFKIGGMRSGGNLYEKFEAVLARMGIEIQFDPEPDNEDYDGTTQSQRSPKDDQASDLQSLPLHEEHRRRRRRNSESSVWYFGPESVDRAKGRPRSYSSSSKPGMAHLYKRLDNNISKDLSQPRHSISRLQTIGRQDQGGTIGAWLSGNAKQQQSISRRSSTSPHGSIARRRNNHKSIEYETGLESKYPSLNDDHASGAASYSSRTSHEMLELTHDQFIEKQVPVPVSHTLLDIKASLIEQHRSQNTLRRVWRLWHQYALQLVEDNANMELLARHRDSQVLIRQAFDTWRTNLREHHQQLETERFFAHLERRATRAREIFLVAKSFTHWAQSASDEIYRTSVARKHILETRYFKAWREVTAVNELKVRRQVVRKFFGIWHKQYVEVLSASNSAIVVYDDNVVQRTFWKWFWSFCGRKAPAWWAGHLKRTEFNKWLSAARESRRKEKIALDYLHYRLKSKAYCSWIKSSLGYTSLRGVADRHATSLLSSKILLQWRAEYNLISPAQKVQSLSILRLKRNSLRTWILRAQQNRQAASIDYHKILREAWVTWNDKTRCRVLQSRIGERLVMQALYKWVLGERMILARRLLDRKLVQVLLQTMLQKSSTSTNLESKNLHTAAEFAQRNLKTSAILNWRKALQSHRQQESMAIGYFGPRLLADALSRWSSQAAQFTQMQRWARDAEFYFVARRALQYMSEASARSKRDKRRANYAMVRRKHKINLASRMLTTWKHRATTVIEMNMRGVSTYNNHNVIHGMKLFDRWRARSEEIMDMGPLWKKAVVHKRFREWVSYLEECQQLEMRALYFFESKELASRIKKWNLAAMHVRAREHLVSELREKHSRKTLRKIVGHWHLRVDLFQKTTLRVSNAGRVAEASAHGETVGEEIWSEYGDEQDIEGWAQDLEGTDTSTSVPGYLSTPSRRAIRTRPINRLSSTTPRGPLSTPFERLLRAQYSGSSSFRKSQGGGLRSDNGGFPDTR